MFTVSGKHVNAEMPGLLDDCLRDFHGTDRARVMNHVSVLDYEVVGLAQICSARRMVCGRVSQNDSNVTEGVDKYVDYTNSVRNE